MADLYVLENCPYCRKVMDFLSENKINFNKKDISNSENHRRLLELGGKDQVPFLHDENVKMYESNDIIDYFTKK